PLFLGKWTKERDGTHEPLRAVRRLGYQVELYFDTLDWPPLTLGIHLHGHGRATAPCRKEQLFGIGAQVSTTGVFGGVGHKGVTVNLYGRFPAVGAIKANR